MSRSLNIISHNIQGLTSQIHTEIKHFIDNNPRIDILCNQETKINNNKENQSLDTPLNINILIRVLLIVKV
jgi:exonuclease III